MSETTDAVAGHAPNLFARWIVDNFPRFQVSCECGWKTAAEDSEQAATASHAEHARQPIGSPTWNPMSEQFERPPSLAEFLLARIAEDHAAAFARGVDAMTGHRWKHLPEPDYIAIQADWLAQSRRGLAECEAKRRIVSYASTLARVADDEGRRRNGADMLCLLALPYADRPDYREEWKP